MSNARKLRVAVLVAVLACSTGRAGLPGSGPGQNMPVIEAPPTFGSCANPISSMSIQHSDAQGADLTLSNTSGTAAHDALVVHVLMNGVPRMEWVHVDLPAGTSVRGTITFLQPVDSPIIELCGNYPGGATDSPDPFLGAKFTITGGSE